MKELLNVDIESGTGLVLVSWGSIVDALHDNQVKFYESGTTVYWNGNHTFFMELI
jgi:hypothetical protein